MVYGTGWVDLQRRSTARFLVMVFALAVTLGLGYLKFVGGRRKGADDEGASAAVGSPDVADADRPRRGARGQRRRGGRGAGSSGTLGRPPLDGVLAPRITCRRRLRAW